MATDQESKVDHGSGAEAELDAPDDNKVTLFHPSGKAVSVDQSDLQFWLNGGFTEKPRDIKATFMELVALWPEALDRIGDYVNGVLEDGHIDPSDDKAAATAEHALRRVENLVGRLFRDIAHVYPIRQGVGVQMRHPENGQLFEIDPAQVELYKKQGWKEAH